MQNWFNVIRATPLRERSTMMTLVVRIMVKMLLLLLLLLLLLPY
jgi:hypothetical protein